MFKWCSQISLWVPLKGQVKVTQPVSQKQCMLGIWLLLIMYRKPYIDIEMVPSDLSLDDLERSSCILEMIHVRHIVTITHV